MKKVYNQFLNLHNAHPEMVLSTITGYTGSTPQKPGFSAVFDANGLLAGTIGGGILEGQVREISQLSLKSGLSFYREFILNKEIESGEDAICGGQVRILFDSRPADHLHVFRRMQYSLSQKIPGVLITSVSFNHDEIVSINRFWATLEDMTDIQSFSDDELIRQINTIIKGNDPSVFIERNISLPGAEQDSLVLLEPVFPLPRVIIAGAGHIGKALAHLCDILDFEVIVVDDRAEFANKKNIPEASEIILGDIGAQIEKLEKNYNTYIVIVTRGHKDDSEALRACLGTNVAYIGMIGSRNKISVMRKDFLNNKWATEEQLNNVHAPVGLNIGSKTVHEIAFSIAAELIMVKNASLNKVKNEREAMFQ